MKIHHYFALGLLASAALSGCGSSNNNNNGTGDVYSPGSNPVGSLQVSVANPDPPAGTSQLTYTVLDQVTNTVVAQQTVAYTSGTTPAVQTFANLPAHNDTVTVQALDASGTVIAQGSNDITLGDGVVSTDPITLGSTQAAGLRFYVQPANVVVNATEPTLAVELVDSNGNLAPSATNTVTLTISNNAGGGNISGTATATPVDGIALFPGLTLSAVGTGYTLAASSTGLTDVTSNTFNVVQNSGSATQLVWVFEPPVSFSQSAAISPAPQVAFEDANGVIVPTSTTPVTVTLSGNTASTVLTGGTTTDPSTGIVTFTGLTISNQGTYTLTASSGSLPPATSSSFTVTQ